MGSISLIFPPGEAEGKVGVPGVGDGSASMRFTTVGTTGPPASVVYPSYTVATPGYGEQPTSVNHPSYCA
jgi:hypothetical protein